MPEEFGQLRVKKAPPLGLLDLANRNTGHPVGFEFQTNSE